MVNNSNLDTFIEEFLSRIDDLELDNYELLMAVSVKLVRTYDEDEIEELRRDLERAGLSSIDFSLMKPGVVSLPVVTGRIHPCRIRALSSMEFVEAVKADSLSRPLSKVENDE